MTGLRIFPEFREYEKDHEYKKENDAQLLKERLFS